LRCILLFSVCKIRQKSDNDKPFDELMIYNENETSENKQAIIKTYRHKNKSSMLNGGLAVLFLRSAPLNGETTMVI